MANIKNKEISINSLSCPNPECGSRTFLTNKTGIRRCRRCGTEWNKKDDKKG